MTTREDAHALIGLHTLKALVEQRREAIQLLFEAGDADARYVRSALAQLADEVIRASYTAIRSELPDSAKSAVALVPLGGYGRARMAPYSDIDLQFLFDKKGRAVAAEISERLLYHLWDLGLKVGYATRTSAETLALVKEDITAATAVLDQRFLAGERALFDEQVQRLHQKYFLKERDQLIQSLVNDLELRHHRYGDTIYILEPNVKFGQGGLRDMQTAVWCAKLRFEIQAYEDLVKLGLIRKRQVVLLREASGFLWRVRHALQFAAGRKNDHLTFAMQERIAQQFGFVDGQSLAVEQFMQTYYLHSKTIQTLSRLMIDRCLPESKSRRQQGSRRRIDADYRLYAGALTVTNPELFESDPRHLVRIFRVAQREGVPIYHFAKELIVRALPLLDSQVRGDFNVAQDFLSVLCSADDGSALLTMHELGVLPAYIPEFEPVMGKVHHDLYHVYTVDVHTMHAINEVKAIARRERTERWSLIEALYAELENPRTLYIATLLHDIGKGYGPGHSERGAQLVESIAHRLHLTEDEADEVRFLIRRHLMLAHAAEKHDLSDVSLLRRLAREIGNLESLKKLYILTVVDMSTTGPQLSASWRDSLLRELYFSLAKMLGGGMDLWNDPQKIAYLRKEAVLNLTFPEHPGENYVAIRPIEEFFGSLPTRYFVGTPAEQIVRHIQLLERLRQEPVVVDFERDRESDAIRVTVCCQDQPGLLSKISGALTAYQLDILDAQINSLTTGAVIDVFIVQDPFGRTVGKVEREAAFLRDIARVLAGEITAQALIEALRQPSTVSQPFRPRVSTEVIIDNTVSSDYTVVEVHALDRIGVLHRITGAIYRLGLTIHLAKISSRGHVVRDVFYVEPRVELEQRIAEVKGALLQSVANLDS